MREKIILAPGINSTELMQSLASRGILCFNVRICGAGELARMAMMRSGIAISEMFINSREETAFVAKAVQGEEYFQKPTYSDIREIANAIRRIRSLVADADEEAKIEEILKKGPFEKKNAALVSVYKKFKRLIAEEHLMDSVSLIRKAIVESKTIDADFVTLEEFPLTPLEKALIDKLSAGNVQKQTLRNLFKIAEDKALKVNSFKNCYGAPNEVETILTDIYSGKDIDKCVVAVTDSSTYAQLFFDYALLYDMPITFGCGIPVVNSNPAKLLSLYNYWQTGGFFGANAISAMLCSSAFDKSKFLKEIGFISEGEKALHWDSLMDVLGGIRFTNNESVNQERLANFKKAVSEEASLFSQADGRDFDNFKQKEFSIPCLEKIAVELALPVEEFIKKYSYIRRGSATNSKKLLMMLDMAASSAIYDELKVVRSSGVEQRTDDLILNILKISVARGRSEAGKLFVTDINGAISAVRENLYIAGLSASKYPGSPKENYLLLDEDLKLFGEGVGYMTSDGRVTQKKEKLLALAKLASNLGVNIDVSFAGMNVSELKNDNASSLVFELYKESSGSDVSFDDLEKRVVKVDYFEPAISATREIGKAYNEGKDINTKASAGPRDVPLKGFLDQAYSPSALENFFSCPKKFMLASILRIPEPSDDNPFETIAANEFGTLAHSLMERLGNSDMSCEDFLKLSNEYFDRFLEENPPLLLQNAETERNEFLEMMQKAYDTDPHRKVVLEEEYVECTHGSGVKIKGFPDRVEKLEDGTYLIVDFKTKRKKDHIQDDIDTCLQIVIYAYLMEQKGFKVSGGEFRYIRLGETVTCKYDGEMKQKLADKLNAFKQAMESMKFSLPDFSKDPKQDTCKYCKYGMICGKAKQQEADDE